MPRGKSERSRKKRSFNKFTNDVSNPVDLDPEKEVNLTTVGVIPDPNLTTSTNTSETFKLPPGKRTKSMARRGGAVKFESVASKVGTSTSTHPIQRKNVTENEPGSSTAGRPTTRSSPMNKSTTEIKGHTDKKVGKLVIDDSKVTAPRTRRLKGKEVKTGGINVVATGVGAQNRRAKKQPLWLGLRTRSSPHRLYETIASLSPRQRTWVKSMGFSRFLGFTVDEIPSKLARYVVDVRGN